MSCVLLQYTFFTICFNYALRQPEYVSYVQEVKGGCDPRPTFAQIPEQAYNTNDYNKISMQYDRGHLVPNADYGCSTFIMGNVVPQLINFNRGAWRVLEEKIRKSYAGKIIMKGCAYEGRMVEGINIPQGCYWLVLDGNGTLIDNGYIDQFTGEESKALPDWYAPQPNTGMGFYLIGVFFFLPWLLLLFTCFTTAI